MFSNFKKRLGVLTAIAVMAALVPALSTSVASAAALTGVNVVAAASDATHSACPGTSAAAAGFTDTTSTDVDCIKMHGITQGVTATTYDPTASVPRWQMALYLTRFATSAATALGTGADQGFTDISGYAADIQTAINQLKQLGVTTGTTATTYSPDDNVTREQMAMFIERLLQKSTGGPGGSTVALKGISTATATYNYTDIDSGSVTFEGHNAIAELYHLGVTGDLKTQASYRPTADITRAEMATMMKNALDHTNARPEGLHLQVSPASGFGALNTALHISHRTASRTPITGTLVDVFSDLVTTATNTPAFSAAGACTASSITDLSLATKCAIAIGDASTDVYGNVAVASGSVADVAVATTVDYWAWTGATGALYNNLTAPGSKASASASLDADSSTLTTTIPAKASADTTDANHYFVSFGTDVTVTVQLKNSATATAVAKPNVAISVAETTYVENDAGDGTTTNANGSVLAAAKTTTGVTDASGSFTYTISGAADPATALTNRTLVNAVFTVTGAAAANADGVSGTSVKVAYNDDAAVNSKVSLVLDSNYGYGTQVATTGISRTAAATVWNQYGVARAGQTVTFESVSTDGASTVDAFTNDLDRVTDSTGVATLGYTDLNDDTTMHTISAYLDDGTGGGTAANNTNHADEPSADVVYYRLQLAPNDLSEVDAASGSAVGTSFTTTTADNVWTFGADHGLAVGNSVAVTTVPVTTGGTASSLATATKYFVISSTTARLITASLTRGGAITAVGGDTTEGTNTAGVAQALETWNGSDVLAEIVYWDDANNLLVISEQTAAGDNGMDYMAFTYETDDQFQTTADGTAAPVSFAAFEKAVKAKMTLASGYTRPNTAAGYGGDVVFLDANNHVADPGVSRIHLGQ